MFALFHSAYPLVLSMILTIKHRARRNLASKGNLSPLSLVSNCKTCHWAPGTTTRHPSHISLPHNAKTQKSLEKVGNRARSRDEVIGDKASNSNHSKTNILKFLRPHLLLPLCVFWPKLEVIYRWFGTSQEGLSIKLLVVFPVFEDSADDEKLSPPLRIGLKDGIDGVGGGHVLGRKGTEYLGKEPSNGGKHCRTAIGELGPACPVNWDVVTEVERVELMMK